jgi:tRNA-binding EMAP/Myf-like protein
VISQDGFRQIELRVGEILIAERVSGSDRLLKLTVDLGGERRSIVGGLGQSYMPEELQGLQVVVVANLAPARIKGIESGGMPLGLDLKKRRLLPCLRLTDRFPTGRWSSNQGLFLPGSSPSYLFSKPPNPLDFDPFYCKTSKHLFWR